VKQRSRDEWESWKRCWAAHPLLVAEAEATAESLSRR